MFAAIMAALALVEKVSSGVNAAVALVQDLKKRAKDTGATTPEQDAAIEAEEARVYTWATRPAPPPPASLNAGTEVVGDNLK